MYTYSHEFLFVCLFICVLNFVYKSICYFVQLFFFLKERKNPPFVFHFCPAQPTKIPDFCPGIV